MKVFEFSPEGVSGGKVRAWLHTNDSGVLNQEAHPVMIVCPGGGYEFVSEREAEPVAQAYFAAGYDTFILNYSVGEDAKKFQPLCQLAALIAQVRKNSELWEIDPNKVAVCGFSAGGHLAASSGILFNEEKFLKVFGRDAQIRPDAMVLSYPVVTADEYAHERSILHVSGAEKGTSEYEWFSLDQRVDSQSTPAFIWHTASDACVPVENSLKLARELSAAKVPFELHIFPEGPHGMSVCTREVSSECAYNARWVEWSIEWLNRLFGYSG